MKQIRAEAILSYPQRSDGRTTAVLTVSDVDAGLPIVEVTLTEADFLAMVRSSHQSQASKARVWPANAERYGKVRDLRFEFFKGHGTQPDDAIREWVASLGDGWVADGTSRTNQGGWRARAARWVSREDGQA